MTNIKNFLFPPKALLRYNPTMYTQPFFITRPVSNNTFSFKERAKLRQEKDLPPPKLYVPSLKEGSIQDIQTAEEIVFEDFDSSASEPQKPPVLKSCVGLKNFILAQFQSKNSPKKQTVPVYIFDNHNHAFFFWHAEKLKGTLKNGATVIHIDQHKDTRIPENFLPTKDTKNLQKLFTYTNTVLNVGNFIVPAQKTGLVGTLHIIDSQTSMDEFNFAALPPHNIIVDIDLDFFSEDMSYIPHEQKVTFTRECLKQADAVTVATSPFFIEQDRALAALREIMEQDSWH